MLSENRISKINQYEMVCIEDLVPLNHILRDIDRAIDFGFIYDEGFRTDNEKIEDLITSTLVGIDPSLKLDLEVAYDPMWFGE